VKSSKIINNSRLQLKGVTNKTKIYKIAQIAGSPNQNSMEFVFA
jgi:hypothetical protein